MKEIIIDGIKYVPEAQIKPTGDYMIFRCYGAGVHAGHLVERQGKEAKITNSRRLWRWHSKFTLSELAIEGPDLPEECKFSMELPQIICDWAMLILIKL